MTPVVAVFWAAAFGAVLIAAKALIH